MPTSPLAVVGLPLAKLASLLILFPLSLTYLHLRFALNDVEVCFAGPPFDAALGRGSSATIGVAPALFHGAYRPQTKQKNDSSDDGRLFVQIHIPSPSFWERLIGVRLSFNWPSAQSASSSILSASRDGGAGQRGIRYTGDKWCFVGPQENAVEFCSEPVENDAVHVFPVGGLYSANSGGVTPPHSAIRVWCAGNPNLPLPSTVNSPSSPSEKADGGASFRKNPNKRPKQGGMNKNFRTMLTHPATSILLGLNVLLAFVYWNNKVSPSSVAKIYSKIVVEHEIWRSFTGATAHFEPLHLGFNMMSLYALGQELEGIKYDSISFLVYNVALIPITTIVMMGLVYGRMKYTNNAALGETSTVGYSGVLFAWMVVTSLERESTCPVPFIPDLCFRTHMIGWFKINASPLVSLFVAQFIMPRVSFVGHLAGIVAGFLLHWNMIPLELSSFAVLIPVLFLVHLAAVRMLVPVKGEDGMEAAAAVMLDMEALAVSNGSDSPPSTNAMRFDGRRMKIERAFGKHRVLVRTRNLIAVAACLSFLVVDIFGSLTSSQCIALYFFHSAVKSNQLLLTPFSSGDREDTSKEAQERSRLGVLWRGSIVSLTLTLLSDSMAVSTWIIGHVHLSSERRLFVNLIPALALLLCRAVVNLTALIAATRALSDVGETAEGIFWHVFGPVLRHAKASGDAFSSVLGKKSSWTPFGGRGATLGGGGAGGGGAPTTEDGGRLI